MVKRLPNCLLIIIALLLAMTCFASSGLCRGDILNQARILFEKQQYNKCIEVLEANFADEKLSHSWLNDDVVIEARNLLGKSYLKTRQYFMAYQTFNFTAGYTMHDEFSYYMNDSFWLIITRDIREYKDFTPITLDGSIEFLTEYSLYNLIIGLLDRFDSNERVVINDYLNQIQWKPFSNQFGNLLLKYFQGEINEESILKEVEEKEKAKTYFFLGAKKELEKNWAEAEKWYNLAIQEEIYGFERLLALSRVGRFSFKFKNEKFDKNETYTSSASLVGTKTGKKYPVSNLFDGKFETCWAYKVRENTNEYVIIDFSQEYFIKGFSVVNGYGRSKQLFLQNKRVKVLELSFSDGTSKIITIKDSLIAQKFLLNKKTSFVKFTVKETYEGSKYDDVCISQLVVY